MKPLAIDLYCGLGGWAEGFLSEGYEVIGFDIERHDYGTGRYPGQLVLQDVTTLNGSQFKDAAVIVASPPCQEFSYWHQFSWKAPNPEHGIALFKKCFEIAKDAAKPLIVENVVGAQRWVGRAAWHYGSFYLWGDVPALMPIGSPVKGFKNDMNQTPFSRFSSKSPERRAASAQIAKIPFPLAQHIARTFNCGVSG